MSGPHIDNFTEAQAYALATSKWWIGRADADIALFQFWNTRLCIPTDVFAHAVGKLLAEPELTIVNIALAYEGLERQLLVRLNRAHKPSFDEIMLLLNEEHRDMLLFADDRTP